MDRSEFIRNYKGFIKSVGIKPSDMYVVAGGSMLVHSLRESTDDIDAIVTPAIFALIKMRLKPWFYYQDNSHFSGMVVLSVGPFDIHMQENPVDNVVVVDGVACQSLDDVLALKQKLNRPKDQVDIEKLTKRLSK